MLLMALTHDFKHLKTMKFAGKFSGCTPREKWSRKLFICNRKITFIKKTKQMQIFYNFNLIL